MRCIDSKCAFSEMLELEDGETMVMVLRVLHATPPSVRSIRRPLCERAHARLRRGHARPTPHQRRECPQFKRVERSRFERFGGVSNFARLTGDTMPVFSDFSLIRIHFQSKVDTAILSSRTQRSFTNRYLH